MWPQNQAKVKKLIEDAVKEKYSTQDASLFAEKLARTLDEKGLIRPDGLIHAIVKQDIQIIAKRKCGRKLTEDELRSVRKDLEEGLMWYQVAQAAIENALLPT